jgi:hypothetical protein
MTQPEAELVTWKDADLVDGGKTGRTTWFLAGMRGTVQFVVMEYTLQDKRKVQPVDLGYHSPVPLYETQRALAEPGDCTAFRSPHKRATCYYDGSGLNADRVWRKTGNDDDAIYRELRDFYFDTFYDGSYEAGHTGTPYRTPEERDADMLTNCKILYEARPNEDIANLIRSYEERLA